MLAHRRGLRRRLQQLAVQPSRFCFWLQTFALEHRDARLIVPQRGSAASLLCVEPHERLVHRLQRRIEPEQFEADLYRRLDRIRSEMMAEQFAEGFYGQIVQSLPLRA